MNWNEFFRSNRGAVNGVTSTVEDLYQAFRERLVDELRVSPIGGAIVVKDSVGRDPAADLEAQQDRVQQLCPVCKRSFPNLQRHIQTEHPENERTR